MTALDPEPLDALDADSWDVLEQLGRSVQDAGAGLPGILDNLLRTVQSTVAGCDFGGINMQQGARFEPQAVLGDPPNQLDLLQQEIGVGPCIEASREQQVMCVPDTADEQRWPQYIELARTLGVGSILCVPMWIDEHRLGSISVYSRTARVFHQRQERTVALLATHAAVALAGARRVENLATALRNRDVIGQAKGVLMERHRITADAAFDLLSTASQRLNRKLAVVAEEVASTGTMPA